MLAETALRAGSLCVVGNINRDLKSSPLEPDDSLFEDGETPVDWIVETVGGGGANSAFAAAALGARVTFLAKVGAEGLGDRLEKTLRAHGVSAFLARDPSHRTGSSLALSFKNGHRHFLSCLPASRALEFKDLDLRALDHCQHLLRADLWFSEAMLFGGNQLLFDAARKRGIPISIDLNWDPAWGKADPATIRARKNAVRDLLPFVSLAHGNSRELSEFANTPDLPTALKRISDWGAAATVVHLGKEGAGYYRGGTLEIEPPVFTESQVTSTGCGDVLSVCMMLLHQNQGAPIRDQLRLANTIVSEFMGGKRRLIPSLAD